MTLAGLVAEFVQERGASALFLDSDRVLGAAINATRFYQGFADLEDATATTLAAITEDTDVTPSEWAVIAPLFRLYVERETAVVVEASRGAGLEPMGRASSEVESEIQQRETDMQTLAFCQPYLSVGIAPA